MDNKIIQRLTQSRTNKIAYITPALVAGLETLKAVFPDVKDAIGPGCYVAGSVFISAAVVYFRTFLSEDKQDDTQ